MSVRPTYESLILLSKFHHNSSNLTYEYTQRYKSYIKSVPNLEMRRAFRINSSDEEKGCIRC